MNKSGWIAVDLDGTLAEYGQWQGADHIGKPIPKMVARVKQWLSEGKNVKIFTARVWPIGLAEFDLPEYEDRSNDARIAEEAIDRWCFKVFGQYLEITCSKDYHMYELWDDRAVQVIPNTGNALGDLVEELTLELARLRANEARIVPSQPLGYSVF